MTMEEAAASTSSCVLPSSSLQLLSFSMRNRSSSCPILQCLPAGRLTHLQCGLNYSSAWQRGALVALTALRSLCLVDVDPRSPSDVLIPLSSLHHLVRLCLYMPHFEQLQYLPPWLQVLELVRFERNSTTQQLRLGYLTALSALHSPVSPECAGLDGNDVLPPNLRVLEWPSCCSVKPLLALSRLESLRVTDALTPTGAAGVAGTQLQQLSNLPNLADLQLTYGSAHQLSAATAAAWSALPLKSLVLLGGVPAAVMQRLSALQGLTRLVVFGSSASSSGQPEVTPAQLAAILQHLTALRSLQVTVPSLDTIARGTPDFYSLLAGVDGAGLKESRHGTVDVAACVQAMSRMPALASLNVLLPVPLDRPAQQQLASTASQLLHLDECQVYDRTGRVHLLRK